MRKKKKIEIRQCELIDSKNSFVSCIAKDQIHFLLFLLIVYTIHSATSFDITWSNIGCESSGRLDDGSAKKATFRNTWWSSFQHSGC